MWLPGDDGFDDDSGEDGDGDELQIAASICGTSFWPHWYREFMKPVEQDQNYNGEIRLHTNSNFKLL